MSYNWRFRVKRKTSYFNDFLACTTLNIPRYVFFLFFLFEFELLSKVAPTRNVSYNLESQGDATVITTNFLFCRRLVGIETRVTFLGVFGLAVALLMFRLTSVIFVKKMNLLIFLVRFTY